MQTLQAGSCVCDDDWVGLPDSQCSGIHPILVLYYFCFVLLLFDYCFMITAFGAVRAMPEKDGLK